MFHAFWPWSLWLLLHLATLSPALKWLKCDKDLMTFCTPRVCTWPARAQYPKLLCEHVLRWKWSCWKKMETKTGFKKEIMWGFLVVELSEIDPCYLSLSLLSTPSSSRKVALSTRPAAICCRSCCFSASSLADSTYMVHDVQIWCWLGDFGESFLTHLFSNEALEAPAAWEHLELLVALHN